MGGVVANHIAVWNGSTWAPLGTGLDGTPVAIAGFDDGTGPALYVSGNFIIAGGISTFGFAKWNGSTWSLAPFVPPGGIPKALAVFNDGSGPHLYAGGNYAPSGVMKLTGGSWAAVPGYPGILSADVRALSVIDVGAGPLLYSVGQFTTSSGTYGFFGRWNGTLWQGQPVNGPPTTITAVTTPSGVSVYLGGQSAPGSSFVACVIGTATGPLSGLSGNVLVLSDFDDGTGPALYAAGFFSFPPSNCLLARWNGMSWSPVDQFPCGSTHYALAKFDFGSGPELVAGGDFTATSGVNARNVARWSGTAWNSVVSGQTNGIAREIDALKSAALGSGPALYAGGVFCGGNVARLDANGWQPLGGGLPTGVGNPTVVTSLETFDDGTGPALYAGGYPSSAPSVNMALGRWNGTAWLAPGGGVAGGSPTYMNAGVSSLRVFDDGSGAALFVGGFFDHAGGVPVSAIAKWNGISWSALSGGLGVGTSFVPSVQAMEIYDDGAGPALYVSGCFSSAGGQSAQGLAKWNGTTWTGIPTGSPFSGCVYPPTIASMAALDDGSGPALYVAGHFSTIGGVPAPGYAKWNGQAWTPGILPPGATSLDRLTVLDDGTGPALCAAIVVGSGANAVTSLQRWNGSSWTQLGLPFQTLPAWSISVKALANHDDGSGQAIFAGGSFLSAGGIPSVTLAKWRTSRPTLSLTQVAGPGSAVLISDLHLLQSHEYFNLFSTVPCAGPGFGPYLGLCAPDLTPLILQLQLPLGTVPFHFAAGGTTASFGLFSVPPGLVIDGVCFDYTGAALGCRSPVFRLLVQ